MRRRTSRRPRCSSTSRRLARGEAATTPAARLREGARRARVHRRTARRTSVRSGHRRAQRAACQEPPAQPGGTAVLRGRRPVDGRHSPLFTRRSRTASRTTAGSRAPISLPRPAALARRSHERAGSRRELVAQGRDEIPFGARHLRPSVRRSAAGRGLASIARMMVAAWRADGDAGRFGVDHVVEDQPGHQPIRWRPVGSRNGSSQARAPSPGIATSAIVGHDHIDEPGRYARSAPRRGRQVEAGRLAMLGRDVADVQAGRRRAARRVADRRQEQARQQARAQVRGPAR